MGCDAGMLRQFLELEQFGGERKLGDVTAAQLSGFSGKRVDEATQATKNRLRHINIALENLTSIGEGKGERAKELRSLRARLSRRLGTMK